MESTFFLKTFLISSDSYQLLCRSALSCYKRISFHCPIDDYYDFLGPIFSSFLDHVLSGWKICSSNCSFLERLCGKQILWVFACLKMLILVSHLISYVAGRTDTTCMSHFSTPTPLPIIIESSFIQIFFLSMHQWEVIPDWSKSILVILLPFQWLA